MRTLLVFLLAGLSFSQEFDPAPFPDATKRCTHVDFMTCWDGCRKTQCGGIGATILGFEMETPGAWYSDCSQTGIQCTDPAGGHACEMKTITLTYRDCNGYQSFLTIQPCCEGGGWYSAVVAGRPPIVIWPELPEDELQAKKATCAVADSLLPIPVMEVL